MKLKKITRRVNGREKKGVSGNAVKYITSGKAIKKLQITPADFRRLCILKGIFPRPAPKGAKAKDKTYYHLKDIQFMAHEPILHKYRELKVYLRKRTRFLARKEKGLADSLEAPKIKIDHLVKERYPAFLDAIRDLDDALTMLHLFQVLRVRVHLSYMDTRAATVARLVREWKNFIIKTRTLTKVFVSIKGYYYQAEIKGVPVTWLVPHATVQNTPEDVDYSVMTTFLEFYEALLRCVNFKLYKEEKIEYPPKYSDKDEEEAAKNFFKAALNAIPKKSKKASTAVTLSKDVKAKIAAADKKSKQEDDDENSDDENDTNAFHQLDPDSLNLINEDQKTVATLFADQVFLINREVPFEAVSFVIRAAGGVALREIDLTPEQLSSNRITYQIIDRPSITNTYPSRKYVQPQWVFDSFNTRALLPVEPFGIGAKLPPHLSPFVDDVKEGYVPEQRNVLRQWAGLKPLKQSVLEKIEKTQEEIEQEEQEKEQEQYQKELKSELAKKSKSKKQQVVEEEEEEEEIELEADEDFGDDDDEDDEDIEIDDEDDEIDEEALATDNEDEDEEEVQLPIKKPAPAPRPSAYNPKDNERELSKIVMNKKDKRLLTRMEFGIKRKQTEGKILEAKKRAAEVGDVDPALPKAPKSRRLR